MKVVIAPDKFKDCLSAPDVAASMAEGARRAGVSDPLQCPIADGGEGTVAALVAATNGTLLQTTVTGPLPSMRVTAPWGLLGDGCTAVIEMAAAAGLALLKPDQRDPRLTTTFGVGELLRAALDHGAKRIILGIGGSATTDAGIGCAQACGAKVWIDTNPRSRSRFNTEEALPVVLDAPFTGADLATFHSLLKPALPHDVQIRVACDVTNPLFGPTGAAPVFAPQKGATPDVVEDLDAGLQRVATRTRNLDKADFPGAGAAGGLGFGMLAFFNATLQSGVQLVLDAIDLRSKLAGADLCITGEGRLDRSSLSGKAPVGVARLCHELGVPCVAIVGITDVTGDEARAAGFARVLEIAGPQVGPDERIRRAREFLADAARQVVSHHR